ncbi:AT-rich interactive domain-containing protein 6-like [Phragmites australis]|uniref:AT-rich interactive domain-containing protein 6-like n=1 Tax=Phragmites australis TaxID=29695 RepID=UPI002D783D9A|nr:AT-rich interactive domain-containing protein 6-like [Phragmites australis]
MSDARGGTASLDRDGDDPNDLPHAEKEAVPVAEVEAAPARGRDSPPDTDPESDEGEGEGSPDRAEPNVGTGGGGQRAPVAEGCGEREGIVGGAWVETNGEDAIRHDGDGEEEDDEGDEEEDDDDDHSTPDASPRAEVKVEGESSTGMAQSGASHRVESDPFLDGDDSGTEEEQAAFMVELERFHREHSLEFKPPKFYGKGLNCLKLWRQVAHLGGHEQVTVCKLWRQVGETFRPPKTCTTVSWSFRIFYEKALLEYEKHKVRTGQLQIPPPALPQPGGTDHEMVVNPSSSARVRRDAAVRAMQGWHAHRLLANDTYGDHISKDKDSVPLSSRDKKLKGFGVLKRKKASSPEYAHKPSRTKINKSQEDSMVIDVGEPADWVKINVRQTKDCFEVYALVPGLLREEVHVQSDPAGRLVITGDPEQADNPWGITPFKKVVNLPSRIDPHQTSAVVTLHGQLFVRAPFGHADM